MVGKFLHFNRHMPVVAILTVITFLSIAFPVGAIPPQPETQLVLIDIVGLDSLPDVRILEH